MDVFFFFWELGLVVLCSNMLCCKRVHFVWMLDGILQRRQ
jgi:hypothetical protein